MDFRILGPLEVLRDGDALALGGPKPRAVLAVLLLHANEPVSAERLAIELWGEEVPAGAIKTVRVHVSRLRNALGDRELLETTAAGYRLRVRPNELDLDRFEQLVADGRRALAAGHAEEAAATLRNALGLWRGRPLADLAFEPFAQPEIARLEEQRLSALEARVQADLGAGRHDRLIADLQQLVNANPTRERLAGQLMLALYRCGRQDEAVEMFRVAWRELDARIGQEPGPELRSLHELILRQDASLELPPAVPDEPSEDIRSRKRRLPYGRTRLAALALAAIAVIVAISRGPAETDVLLNERRAEHVARETLDAFNSANWPGVQRHLLPRVVYEEPAAGLLIRGRDDTIVRFKEWRHAFEDARGKIVGQPGRSTRSAQYEIEWSGRQTGPLMIAGRMLPPTNRRILLEAHIVAQINDGKITRIIHRFQLDDLHE